jgi:CubicO group peptidase (beta-lactamase class C family)
MSAINRRQFVSLAALAATQAKELLAGSGLDQTLRDSMTRRKIPAVVAMVATPDKITYTGAFGKRDSHSGIDVKPDSIFAIASMTKAITSAAAMQLVEQGKVKLHEPVCDVRFRWRGQADPAHRCKTSHAAPSVDPHVRVRL